MPMILWSSEKMYFRRNPSSGWAWVAAVCAWSALLMRILNLRLAAGRRPARVCDPRLNLAAFGFRAVLLCGGVYQPLLVVRLVFVDVDQTAHLVVAPAAKLGAGQLRL